MVKLKLDKIIQRDLQDQELEWFLQREYVCVDTETTGLDYKKDNLCTIQLYSEGKGVIIKYEKNITQYENLKKLMQSNAVIKVFHNAVFDVSFLMENLRMDFFGKIVCTKISSKLVNGLEHKNSLKALLKEYINIDISKTEQLSDWSKDILSDEQIEYAFNDVRYLYDLWIKLKHQLIELELDVVAEECFSFVPIYKKLQDKEIYNIFMY